MKAIIRIPTVQYGYVEIELSKEDLEGKGRSVEATVKYWKDSFTEAVKELTIDNF